MIYTLSDQDLNNMEKYSVLDIKISVIVPCYNVSNYITACVKSIVEQTIGLSHLEIILINDASTDETYNMLLNIEQQYPDNILVVNCDVNGKQGRARNIGLSYASGDYITFVDADDQIAPGMLDELIRGLLYCDASIAECEAQMIMDYNNIPKNIEPNESTVHKLTRVESDEEARIFYINQAFETSVCRRLYRRDFIEDTKLCFPEQIFMEDIYFSQLAMIYCKSMYQVNIPYYLYYIHPDSTMHSARLASYYMDIHKVSTLVIETVKERGLFETYKDALQYVYTQKVFHDLTDFMSKSIKPFPIHNYQIMKQYIEDTFH
ncbi:MAG TPA: hypothetical protein DHV96_10975 [Lachnospiraceae bacterium]|nr:hypothetical protein [Lachnospiraceae bacterium]